MKRLEGKVALVTGAGGGIGAATAQRLAIEGAQIGVIDLMADGVRETGRAIESAGGQALELVCDVSSSAALTDLVRRLKERFGRIDILVNNAGINRDALAARLTEEQWDQVLTVNLKATFLCAQAALALEWARYGIRVNCVAPGGTDTRMTAGIPADIRAKLTETIPLKRFAQASEIAAAHAFLVSDDASFITGQVLFVDGGASIGSTF